MDKLNLQAHQITLLCLTGGTCQIPDFEQFLCEMALNWKEMKRRFSPDHFRFNVVRGATRRPGLRIRGLLWSDIQLQVKEKQGILRKGAVVGAKNRITTYFAPHEKARVEVRAVLTPQETPTLYCQEIINDDPDPEGLYLEASIEYVAQQLLQLRLVWLTKPEREALPWTIIQKMPAM